MLQPKRTKFRKQQKMRNRCLAHRGNKVSFGEFGLQALDFEGIPGHLSRGPLRIQIGGFPNAASRPSCFSVCGFH